MVLFFIIQAVNPRISLKTVIEKWGTISLELQDPLRKRKKQIQSFFLS